MVTRDGCLVRIRMGLRDFGECICEDGLLMGSDENWVRSNNTTFTDVVCIAIFMETGQIYG